MPEVMIDEVGRVEVLNDTLIDTDEVFRAMSEQQPELAAMVRWTNDTRSMPSRHGGLFERDRYVTPDKIYDQFRTAQMAAENDDVVAGVIETTESFAFSKVSLDCDEEDESNVYNQIAADIDLDSR